MYLDELKSAKILYEDLNINPVELENSIEKGDLKENDMKKKKRKTTLCTFNRKFSWCIFVCVAIVYFSSLIQVGNQKKGQIELP